MNVKVDDMPKADGTLEVFVAEDQEFVARVEVLQQEKFVGAWYKCSHAPTVDTCALGYNLFEVGISILCQTDVISKEAARDICNEMKYLMEHDDQDEEPHGPKSFPF